jgi:hypothetical protein
MHLHSLCQTWSNLKAHTVLETENRTPCLTTVRQTITVSSCPSEISNQCQIKKPCITGNLGGGSTVRSEKYTYCTLNTAVPVPEGKAGAHSGYNHKQSGQIDMSIAPGRTNVLCWCARTNQQNIAQTRARRWS